MIGTGLYKGQGLGNQLWVYAVTRSAALRGNYDFGIVNDKNFKGKDFLSLDFGITSCETRLRPTLMVPSGYTSVYFEQKAINIEYNCDVSTFDKQIFLPSDGTFLEGPMQSEKYIFDYKQQIAKWYAVPGIEFDGCIINLRGGEYRKNTDLFLAKDYYYNAIHKILEYDSKCDFMVVTDDLKLAKEFFPNYPIKSSGGVKIYFRKIYISPKSHLIGQDFSLLQNAKYLILSNSSFSWWGAWTNTKVERVIAPMYWARHNISNGFWSQGDSLTKGWHWLDRYGALKNYDQCLRAKKVYQSKVYRT
jgi:Glycosyl transferase family 11